MHCENVGKEWGGSAGVARRVTKWVGSDIGHTSIREERYERKMMGPIADIAEIRTRKQKDIQRSERSAP